MSRKHLGLSKNGQNPRIAIAKRNMMRHQISGSPIVWQTFQPIWGKPTDGLGLRSRRSGCWDLQGRNRCERSPTAFPWCWQLLALCGQFNGSGIWWMMETALGLAGLQQAKESQVGTSELGAGNLSYPQNPWIYFNLHWWKAGQVMSVSTNYFTFIIVVIFWHRTCAHHCLIHETCSLKIGVLLTAVLPDAVRVPCLVRLLKVRQALKSVVCGWNWGHWSRSVQGKSRSFHLHFLPSVMGLIVAVYNFACFPWHLWTYAIIRCIRYTSLQLPGNYLMLSGNGSRPGGCSVSDSCFVLPGTAGTARTAWGDRRRRRAALGLFRVGPGVKRPARATHFQHSSFR